MNRNLYFLHSIASSLYYLQLNKLLRHPDSSCELVHSTVWILAQQIVREKQIDSTSKTPY